MGSKGKENMDILLGRMVVEKVVARRAERAPDTKDNAGDVGRWDTRQLNVLQTSPNVGPQKKMLRTRLVVSGR